MNIPKWTMGWRRRVLHRRSLNSESAYRVVSRRGSTVEVEVLNAPGLRPGAHLHITADAARAMQHQDSRTNERVLRFAGAATRFLLARSPKLKLPTA